MTWFIKISFPIDLATFLFKNSLLNTNVSNYANSVSFYYT